MYGPGSFYLKIVQVEILFYSFAFQSLFKIYGHKNLPSVMLVPDEFTHTCQAQKHLVNY